MQTSIAQAAALTIFGNDTLRGYPREDFWPDSTVFRFCKNVRFVVRTSESGAASEGPFAENPKQWISTSEREGTVGLRLHRVAGNNPRIPDRLSAGFVGGGGRWLIEALHAQQSDLWEARWQVVSKDDPDQKIWDVAYRRIVQGRPRLPLQDRGLTELQQELRIALRKIEAFADRQALKSFASAFQNATDALSSDQPLSKVFHSDLSPTSTLPLGAKQLLAAAQTAWVFGGMGSWNDLGFDGKDDQEYREVSDALFMLLNEAICSAVNLSIAVTVP